MYSMQKVINEFWEDYKKNYQVSWQEQKIIEDIKSCKTDSMGGNTSQCEECGHTEIHYNSCRNRHCPCCQAIEKEIWTDKKMESTIEAPYFHLVFTVPEQLRMMIYQNQKLLYDLMYAKVKETLTELAKDPKYLGAQIGFFCVLHTWSDDLIFHPHIHAVVMAGGLTKQNQWRQSSQKFFIPVKVLAKVFRGKFLHQLKKYYYQNRLNLYGENQELAEAASFEKVLTSCYDTNWYTYSKETFSGQQELIRYLSRYTHRIAISNQRITSIDKQTVTISTKNKNGGKKEVTMAGVEFIRRFLMHALPKGFVRIRNYGLLANRNKKTKLALCRKLTGSKQHQAMFENLSKTQILSIILGYDVTICSECKKGRMYKTYLPSTKAS